MTQGLTFKAGETQYRLRRTWWGGWMIERADRTAVMLGFKPWWGLSMSEAFELVAALQGRRTSSPTQYPLSGVADDA